MLVGRRYQDYGAVVWSENKGVVVCMVVPKPGECIRLKIVHDGAMHTC